MDGRNGAVNLFVRHIPRELNFLIREYQHDRRLISLRQAIVELLETHPSIAERASRVYNEPKDIPPPS